MNYAKKFIVRPGSIIDLDAIDTAFTGDYTGKNAEDDAKDRLKKNRQRIKDQQELLFVGKEHSLLLINQAMDAAGKDGLIEHVYSAMNLSGVRTVSFKAPTPEERAHHYLWRIRPHEPGPGLVSIFNRSQYEEVLIVRVRNLIPENVWRKDFKSVDDIWPARFREINDYESELAQKGTRIRKFFLHISKEEQLRRLWDRVRDPTKHWKVNEGDFDERQLWDQYQRAYEAVFAATSTQHAPWFIIPADHKWFARVAVSEILADDLESMGMKYPKPAADIDAIKKKCFGIKNPGDKPRFDLI